MSTERPGRGLLVFQCDVCFETLEVTKEEHDTQNFAECWAVAREEGWTISSNGGETEHHCADCAATAKADRDNPFRR